LTVNPNPTVNVGGAVTAICQAGTTAALGGSFGGGATAAVWSDGGAGGSFTNNTGSTPGTTTYTASATAPASVTLTLTTSGGSCGTTSAGKIVTVNPKPTVNVGGAVTAICQAGTTAALGGSFGGGATQQYGQMEEQEDHLQIIRAQRQEQQLTSHQRPHLLLLL